MNEVNTMLASFIRKKRKQASLTQADLALKAGVGVRFVRYMEQGKETLRMDKVNQVIKLFGHELAPIPVNRKKLTSDEEG
jgi:y4mF family transcriptional regulator